ncbi:MAG: hypothetical protein DPW09_26880 [Anaerolineae bacterium]|nr:hypothetical protein [Anaerolineae bacterium]
MRKKIIGSVPNSSSPASQEGWLDLERLAQVELTSENAAHPIEAALAPGLGPGWRAAQPGEQTIRFLFDEPQRLRRIHLVFEERERARTQEFVLRWSADSGQTYREIVRQQYHFSPPGTVREVEDYGVELEGMTMLELRIVPDISGGDSWASVAMMRLG